MKGFAYMADVRYLGERCRLWIIAYRIYFAVSRERFRINFDLTL